MYILRSIANRPGSPSTREHPRYLHENKVFRALANTIFNKCYGEVRTAGSMLLSCLRSALTLTFALSLARAFAAHSRKRGDKSHRPCLLNHQQRHTDFYQIYSVNPPFAAKLCFLIVPWHSEFTLTR
jgi:hypothetical protein